MPSEDPRYATTLSEFLVAGNSSDVISFPKLCFTESSGNIKYTVQSVIDDYLKDLKDMAIGIELSDSEAQKYEYRPKLLSSETYGTTELYYMILLLNGMCNTKEFDLKSRKLLMLSKNDMVNSLNSIYKAEHDDIAAYNSNYN